MPSRVPETTLHPAVKTFLEAQGFTVKGEVRGCDIVAVRDTEPPILVICELNLGFSLELVLQGLDRMRAADDVWLAVAATKRGRDRDSRAHRLCRMLGFGLLAVTPAQARVEILVEPAPYQPRRNAKARKRILKEHAARRGDLPADHDRLSPAGPGLRRRDPEGPKRPRDLRPVCGPRTSIPTAPRPFRWAASPICRSSGYCTAAFAQAGAHLVVSAVIGTSQAAHDRIGRPGRFRGINCR